MRQKGFAPIIIVIVLAIAGISGAYYFGNKKVNTTPVTSEVLPSPPPIMVNSPAPKQAVPIQATPTSGSTSTTVTTGKLIANLHVLYTQENIENYGVSIFRQTESAPMIKSTGTGNIYQNDNLPAGQYRISVQTGRNEKYCGSSGNGIDSSTVDFVIKAGQTTNLDVNIFPYPGFVYLRTKNGFPVANATINSGFYSANTDKLGRAVLYTINPGPYNLKVSYQGKNFEYQTAGASCMWLQAIEFPADFASSLVSVTINPTVEYLSLTPELIIKEEPLNIKPNAVGNHLVYDDIRKYTFMQSRCSGLGSTYFKFGYMISLSAAGAPGSNNTGNTVTISQVDPGDYDVCVYESGKPGIYWASSMSTITVNNGNPVSVTIDYPKK